MGRRMSGRESWAIVAPSVNSTIEWTIDCGCTTTSIWSYGAPNSSWASITSRPLFMSVEESTVIFGPMLHVGWASASLDGDLRPGRRGCGPGTGPPLAVSTMRARSAPPRVALARRHWCTAQCSESTGTSSAPGRAPQRLHHRPGGDQRLLVGQRQALAGRERRQGDRQPGEADHAVDHDVGIVGERGQRVGPRPHLALGQRRPQRGLVGRVGDRRRPSGARARAWSISRSTDDDARARPPRTGRARRPRRRGSAPRSSPSSRRRRRAWSPIQATPLDFLLSSAL